MIGLAGNDTYRGGILIRLMPAFIVSSYPWLLRAFHQQLLAERRVLAAVVLTVVCIVPVCSGLFAAWSARTTHRITVQELRFRRLAYFGVCAPTLFVFLGVVQGLVHSPLPDELIWVSVWLCLAAWAWSGSVSERHHEPSDWLNRWRVYHGISGAAILLYVLFHLVNHLFGLQGPAVHAAVMKAGRHLYRAPFIEPILVGLMMLQVFSGFRLAWRWSAQSADWRRVFQIASGFYLSVFILGHMNSVFIYARAVHKIDTGWDFATGAPTGLLYDAWNIRLLPHYAFGVFFVLAHLASGARVVLLAHGISPRWVNRGWSVGALLSVTMSAAIIAGMCGVRISH